MPSWLNRLFGGSSSEKAPAKPPHAELPHADLLERARNDLALKTSLHDSGWGIGSASWAADLEAGILTFDARDGRRITAPVQVIGTLDTLKGDWLWGWDHPSVPEPLSRHAALVRDYGAARGLSDLTTRKIPCDEAKAWEFAALANLLAEAQGAYRGPAGTTLVFMTFGTVTMEKGTMQPAPKSDLASGLDPVEAPEVLSLVRCYCAEIYAVEHAYAALPEDRQQAEFKAAIEAQQPIYDRYWRREDDHWRPSSLSTSPESDLSMTRDWQVFSRGPDQWRVTYTRDIGIALQRGFDVARFPDGLKITDALF